MSLQAQGREVQSSQDAICGGWRRKGTHGETWTQERIEQLIALRAEGMTAKEIATRIGITPGAVSGKLRRLEIAPPPSKTRWLPEDEAVLTQMWNDGASMREMSERLGRTNKAIFYHRMVLGLTQRRNTGVWTPERIAELERGYASNLSVTEIAERLGMTRHAIIGKAWRLRGGTRGSWCKRRVVHVWTDAEDAILRELFPNTSVAEICRELRIGKRAFRNRALKLGLVSSTTARKDPVRRPAPQSRPGLPRLQRPLAADPPESERVALVDLGPRHCRAICGDGDHSTKRYCGRTIAYRDWCADHAAVFYQRSAPRMARGEV